MALLDFISRSVQSFQAAGQFQRGRRAFLAKRYQEALAYFNRATRSDPESVFECEGFRESLWTYIGRAQYGAEKFGDARGSLERALIMHADDHLAGLFLGVTRIHLGDRANGVREIERALKGLHDWLESSSARRSFDVVWDPEREIRAAIETLLAMISRRDFAPEILMSSVEGLGQRMEDEIDRARRDASRPNE